LENISGIFVGMVLTAVMALLTTNVEGVDGVDALMAPAENDALSNARKN